MFTLALDLFKKGRRNEGRSLMLKLTEDISANHDCDGLRAAALKSLAIDAEWRLGDIPLALSYTNSALAIAEISGGQRNELEKRRGRLEEKNSK